MTALSAPAAPATKKTARLRPVAAARPSAPPKLSYVIGTLLGLFAILIGQLGLSIALGNGAYEIRDLERQLAERSRDLSVVSEEIGQMQDPNTLAQMAVSLGMVDDGDPAYLRLSDAAVVGAAAPAESGSTSVVSVVPGEDAALMTEAAQIVALQASQGESLPGFAALDDDTNQVPVPGDTLDGVSALVPETPAPTQNFGGDLPAPTTR